MQHPPPLLPLHTDHPTIDGLDPKYILAISSSLATDIDPAVTGPHIADEHYWERVCLEVGPYWGGTRGPD
jgi:hypothetical protein